MSRSIGAAFVVALTAAFALGTPITNGTFDAGLDGWTTTGPTAGNQPVVLNAGGEIPASPSGAPAVGKIIALGFGTFSINQTVDWTGPGLLDLEYFVGAKTFQANKQVSLDVIWNGEVLASYAQDPVDGATANTFQWQQSETPIMGVGSNQLKVQWVFRFAERSWAGVDNVSVMFPEPASLSLLALAGGAIVAFPRRKRA